MAQDTGAIKETFKALMRECFPELGGYQFPIKAKVMKVHESGGKVDDFNKRYSVDVQPLKMDGTIDENMPEIPDIPIDIQWAGPNRGVLALPEVGAVVRVGFYYWDASCPYVDGILADGYSVPAHPLGSYLIQQKDGVFIKIDPKGNIELETSKEIRLKAGSSKVTLEPSGSAKIDASKDISLTSGKAQMTLKASGDIDMANGALGILPDGTIRIANGGPAVARVGDPVDCPCGTGAISGGSLKVECGG